MSYNYYHSFPRRFCSNSYSYGNEFQIQKGLEIFESILTYGVLLVPEIVEFDGELDTETGNTTSELLALQRRFCLTHLNEEQLTSHASSFGGFHLEFSEISIRKLGAIPVFYIPKSNPNENTGLDILGNTLLHRLSEIQDILRILSEIDSKLTSEVKSLFKRSIKLYSNENDRKISHSDLSWFLNSLKEGKQEFKELAATIEVLSYIFYPTKRRNVSNSYSDNNIYYYLQREWRVIGGISLNMNSIDDDLTEIEKVHISNIDTDFFRSPISNHFDSNTIIDECKVIRDIEGTPIKNLISRIYAPKHSKNRLKNILSYFNLDIDIIYTG